MLQSTSSWKWKEVFANHNLIRNLYLKYINNSYNSIIKRTQFKKWTKDLNRYLQTPISTLKDATGNTNQNNNKTPLQPLGWL